MTVSHIDDGQLNAWLDGALGPETGPEGAAVALHLAGCESCRDRLESAREDARRARLVLAAADAPIPGAPAFEEIVARARGKGDAGEPLRSPGGNAQPGRFGRRILRPGRGLAWAASIAAVVGAGLLARELVIEQGREVPAVFESRGARSADVPGGETPAAPAPEARQRVELPDAEDALREGSREDIALERVAPTVVAEPEAAAVEEEMAAPSPKAEDRDVPAEPLEQQEDAAFAARAKLAGAAPLPVAGCWRRIAPAEGTSAPDWFRLLEGASGRGLVLEPGDRGAANVEGAAGWEPVGPDSIRITVPPISLRLARVGDELLGEADPGEALADAAPTSVRYVSVACPIP